jgi:tetratricopeptide (TPR) repeat protein
VDPVRARSIAAASRVAGLALLVLLLCFGAGCRSTTDPSGPYSPPEAAARNQALAERLVQSAAEALPSDPSEAERLLRAALGADLFHGPAHNNLGVLLLHQGKLYEAAQEFEWARKLLPGHPDPRVNLALTLEAAGRDKEALESFDAALQAYPGHLPAMMGAASLALRTRIEDERLGEWLREIALRAEEPGWREWALARLAALTD